MVSPVICFRSVVALVDRFPVLAGIDFDAETGEVVLLRGANGAGKTSLLRAIAGLLPIAQGSATVLGVDILQDRKSIRRHIGLLGHHNALYGELTVRENVEFAVRAAGLQRSAAYPAMQQLELDGRLADVVVDRLSSGQRRRTSLCSLLARDPELWLLDEPHTGLDVEARSLLNQLVAEAAGRGRTIVFSSHETDVVGDVRHREVMIEGGATVVDLKETSSVS